MSSVQWDQIVLDGTGKTPLYKQISKKIEQLVHEGKLKPGTRLPSERRMAELLKVSRMTITLANEDMKSKGIVRSQQGSGTYIMRCPRSCRTDAATSWQTDFTFQTGIMNGAMEEIMRYGLDSRLINLAGAGTAPEVHPGIEISQCFVEHLRNNPILLQLPAPTQGYEPLILEVRKWLAESDIHAKPEETMIVSGAMQGIDLISRLFLGPDDCVIMEDPGFPAASDVFLATGAKVLRITLDQEGIRMDSLENLLMQFPVKLIYLNPTFHNPTGITLSLERRKRLLELAKKYKVLIVEDDPSSKLYYTKKVLPSLKAMDRDNNVIYIQSFSKYLFPSLRVAVLVAPEGIVSHLIRIKQRIDLHSNNLTQIAVHAYLVEGRLASHVEKLRMAYRARLDMAKEVLKKSHGLRFQIPAGGVFMWCKLPKDLPAENAMQLALKKGVSLVPGNWMSGVGLCEHYIRLAFTHPSIELMKKGMEVICEIAAERGSGQ